MGVSQFDHFVFMCSVDDHVGKISVGQAKLHLVGLSGVAWSFARDRFKRFFSYTEVFLGGRNGFIKKNPYFMAFSLIYVTFADPNQA